MNKNVILLSSFVPANNSSPVSVNSKMARLCSETFFHTDFVTANFPVDAVKDLPEDRFKLTNVNASFNSDSPIKKLLYYIKMQIGMIRFLRKSEKVGTVVIFWLSGPLILPFLYCKMAGFYTVGFLYGNSRKKADRLTFFNWLKAKIMESIAKGSDLMCIESPSVAKHWGMQYNTDKMQIVHLYVDTEKFSPTLEFEQRPKVIGMCGRLDHSKRVLESIKAFSQIRDEFPEYIMEIAGSGPLKSKCKELIKQLGEENRIKLLGWVDNDKLPDFFKRWKLMLAPTNYEGVPNSLLESMACGTPVLSSPVGGIPDVISDGIDGWLLPDNCTDTIAKWLKTLLRDQDKLALASKNSREKILKNYSFEPSLINFNNFAQRIKIYGEK
jgi:glycosyltransferase involved in cell wall biosynthesis